ncbi:hypothetical protein C6341_g1981 [Phytophthora cactorum]|uniref:Uncharacterized protein n=1 Tax=Phytophthora cactorum TaxID=29920 RepID=A0A8T1ENE0_9STRA|nr:hypothetical protein PC117_g2048 [Phytophthora cactorum]KAG3034302.1 hypothetical protein PC120_g1490 [Phytophthora cactorum]KAG3189865.1 hypothetical protein C6341_g1981 [Phytophthora cactorum]
MSAYESFSSDESDGGALNEEDEDYEGVERGGRGDDDGVSDYEESVVAYPSLNTEEAQPVAEQRNLCHSPRLTFFYFMPQSLWVMISVETNRYSLQQVDQRAQAIQAKQTDRRRETLT